ncbi:unnamed protein product [Lactuca saligna]|uniref:NAC domain-containing protein n=1 Tax=Lactuca saligna TaxID=75948 RepID=A0AA36EE14_LACSI|nr:unnamed protein product [Lactuca saligna]
MYLSHTQTNEDHRSTRYVKKICKHKDQMKRKWRWWCFDEIVTVASIFSLLQIRQKTDSTAFPDFRHCRLSFFLRFFIFMGKSLKYPGFSFKPTDVHLVMYYLKNKLLGKKLDPEFIAEININDFSPWDLPAKSILSGDLEWYFFSSNSKKYLSGPRMNRVTKTGLWKGTGKDKEVRYKGRTVGMRKTLIFYVGPPGKRTITNWAMHEYRMTDEDLANQGVAQEAYVICRVFEKTGLGPKNGAQYGAPFDDDDDDDDDDDTSLMMVGVLVNPNNTSCLTLTCPSTKTCDPDNSSGLGPSAITYWEDERVTDDRVNDDVMLTHGDLASLLQNNNTQEEVKEVEDRKGKKVMIDDGVDMLNELLDASNPHDLGQDMFEMFSVEGFDDDFWKSLEE